MRWPWTRRRPAPVLVDEVVDQTARTILRSGRVLHHHSLSACVPPCLLHAPSGHHMVEWPLNWRSDRYLMERICPHGVGHPDPDDKNEDTVHGCCGYGCCAIPTELP